MAARKVSTPGAKTPEPVVETTAQPTTAEQAEAVSEHSTDQDAESQDQSTDETSSLGAPVEPAADPCIDQILQNQARIEKKIDQLLKAGGVEVKKKQRWHQGKNGLELKDA